MNFGQILIRVVFRTIFTDQGVDLTLVKSAHPIDANSGKDLMISH